ncbi:hypothetical protein ACH5RR_004818 [Cinchona calisaya]|uniref:Uncharacterized protein n=1 Tax=Cinchona calisaya TaxID=153742 RepID=A0ABD3AYN1_9GENT
MGKLGDTREMGGKEVEVHSAVTSNEMGLMGNETLYRRWGPSAKKEALGGAVSAKLEGYFMPRNILLYLALSETADTWVREQLSGTENSACLSEPVRRARQS